MTSMSRSAAVWAAGRVNARLERVVKIEVPDYNVLMVWVIAK